jgi:protein-disulfide isomerase
LCAVLLCLAAICGLGCRAQTAPATKALTEDQINHRIEVIVRNHFSLPPDVTVRIGARAKSELPGYQNVLVTLTQGTADSQSVMFLVSDDNKFLARFDKYDLTTDPRETATTAGRPGRGPVNASVLIVSFDDLECPYCSIMHKQLFPDAVTRYGAKIRIVYKDFPLTDIHPWAMHAAVDSNCLAMQSVDGYWNLVDYIHAHGTDISPDKKPETAFANLDKLATDEGARQKINLDTLKGCLTRQDTTAVQASMDEARALHVQATPTLFINGEKLDGALPEEQLWKSIDRALAEAAAPQAK